MEGGRGREKEMGETERQEWNLPSSVSFLRWTQGTGLGARPKPGARSYIWVSHMKGRGPNTWTVFWYFSQSINRKLNWRWNSQGTNSWPRGMPAPQAVALAARPQHWPQEQREKERVFNWASMCYYSTSFLSVIYSHTFSPLHLFFCTLQMMIFILPSTSLSPFS